MKLEAPAKRELIAVGIGLVPTQGMGAARRVPVCEGRCAMNWRITMKRMIIWTLALLLAPRGVRKQGKLFICKIRNRRRFDCSEVACARYPSDLISRSENDCIAGAIPRSQAELGNERMPRPLKQQSGHCMV